MSGRKLAIPTAGGGKLTQRPNGNGPDPSQEGVICAAWQGTNKGEPCRVVIRVDGFVEDIAVTRDASGEVSEYGFPCGVMNVRYTCGGRTQEVLVDAVNQSALTVWAESVECTPQWDKRRIQRLGDIDNIKPCRSQYLVAAISACPTDTGASDARYLDVIKSDVTVDIDGDTFEVCILPIPAGARGIRLLNSKTPEKLQNEDVLSDVEFFAFVTDPNAFIVAGEGWVEAFISTDFNMPSSTSVIIVPPVARFALLYFATADFESIQLPCFAEWILSPNTLPGY